MWIVRLALRRPYTFVVASMLIAVLGIVTIFRMPTDVLPEVDIPVVSVIWTYSGLPPQEMERRIVTTFERASTTTVNDIEHIESQSLYGVSVTKIYFQPGAKIEAAVAQVTAISQTLLRIFPPGITPPLIIRYSASNVPIIQASVNSKTVPEQDLFDYCQNFIRTPLATVQGAQVPLPYGGKPRGILVDINPQALYARGLSPSDVSNAINAQNVILPGGTAKFGSTEYNVLLNASPEVVDALNDLPIREVNGRMIYIRDVAQVRDGFNVQQNIVRANGNRSALLTILKSGGASTLDIISRVKAALPGIRAGLPPEIKIDPLFDQSVFVRASIQGVALEAIIAACLTATMILVFLGSWRSTLIVTISIPLSILTSLLILAALHQTINIMTLGGLALAVGMLVDDATVEIENIHRNLALNKPIRKAILDGAQEIAVPALVSTLSICIVFVPVFFIVGAAKSLFVPLALAVIFAMLASYVLSRTLIPTMVLYLLRNEVDLYRHQNDTDPNAKPKGDFIWRFHEKFEHQFERMRHSYRSALDWSLDHKAFIVVSFSVFSLVSLGLLPFLGRNFFPAVDAGQIRLHVRAPAGTRLEETERVFEQVEGTIRKTIPASDLELVLDNIGIPVGGINLAFGDSATIGSSDGEILIALKEKHNSTPGYVRELRNRLNKEYPNCVFFFQPADIVGQILNFGLPAPIDIQISGPPPTAKQNLAIIQAMSKEVAGVPGAVDVHVHQEINQPDLHVNVDRTRAEQIGLTQRDVANSLLISLSGSGQTAPNYWLNPQNGVSYSVTVQTPQYNIDSLDSLLNTPLIPSVAGKAGGSELLRNLSVVTRGFSQANVSHYNVQPVFDIYASIQGRDLAGVSTDINKIIAATKLPRGSKIVLRGQVESMNASFIGLGVGLVFAILLVYCLMAVNFQSWVDPLIVITALPGALSGILWMLYVTQTPLSVPALMGMIMGIGVATANAILVVTFANETRLTGKDARESALEAGFTRLRPVIMTALAMIIGMLPMALGLSEGGEQNAPLGRAVIGALLVATFATLFFVPVAYSILRKKAPHDTQALDEREEAEYERDHGQPFDQSLPRSIIDSINNNGHAVGETAGHTNGVAVNGNGVTANGSNGHTVGHTNASATNGSNQNGVTAYGNGTDSHADGAILTNGHSPNGNGHEVAADTTDLRSESPERQEH